ncbi:DUF3048 domain-containing protein [Radiobacillus kanasensis]|uniref:DUF3048 domain-containing protein n=1 Tax=Radiobacillus kanasensis TaxID=2844358 RepID=UPI001E309A16|nr:DUF3048 domain-containing protein [Radiobacillus kanasensis]UFT99919.1 DUF3048 domain-containing protein [Radiobacillus kanasensis]
MFKKKTGIIVFILLLLVVLVACKEKDTAESAPKETEEPKETEPVEEEPKFVYPFTGIKTNEQVNNRAVAVMVNNYYKARPQTGLSKADIVFEILAEGNITRFIAFFQSQQPEVVGPVRSAREYYFNLAKDYNALYIYHGAATHVEAELQATGPDNLSGSIYDNDGYLFKRADFREAPHNSYLQFENVYEEAAEQGYEVEVEYEPLPFLTEEEIPNIQGNTATDISFSYFSNDPIHYKYDTASEKYLRYNGDMQTVEYETDEAIQLDNLFILETAHAVIDDAGRREIDLQSGGNALLIQKGKVQEVQWQNVDGRILPYKDGQPVGLVPGQTWVNVIPERIGLNSITIQ